MNKQEASEIIESMIESIRTDPNQFQIEINITGQSITNVGGGTALSITATGGGPGSKTTGQEVTLNGAKVEINQKAGTNAMNQEIQKLIDSLSEISNELKSNNPNGNKISTIYQSLKNTWVPSLITSVLSSILANGLSMSL